MARQLRTWSLLALLAGALALVGCGGGEEDPAEARGPLAYAAPYVDLESGSAQYVDWAAVRSAFDAEDLAGAGSDAQFDFLGELALQGPIGPAYTQSPVDADLIGFGPLDLDWEVTALGDDSGTLAVLGAGDSLDFDAVEAALEECGYEASEIDGGSLFSKDLIEPCGGDTPSDVNTPGPNLANIALLPDAGVVLASGDPDAVSGAVAGEGSALGSAADDLGAELDGSIAGIVEFGEIACDPSALLGSRATPEAIEALTEDLSDLGDPYELLLASVDSPDDAGEVAGRFVLDFADSEQAESELESRRDAFENGVSIATMQPYTDILALDSAAAEGDAIVFDVSPPEAGAPLQLVDAVLQRDLPFAACG